VSPGCDGCYAARTAHVRAGNPSLKGAYAGVTERTEGGVDWTGLVRPLPERLHLPLGWRKPRLIFVNSMADTFHRGLPDEFVAEIFAVMAATPRHTYQVLTKRHARMRALLSSARFVDMVRAKLDEVAPGARLEWPLPNVWAGVSVEDQKRADIRIPALLETPAAVRFLSCEPLLGPVDLSLAMCPGVDEYGHGLTARQVRWGCYPKAIAKIDWVIVGGESGPNARPMHPDWARTIRDQCTTAGVAFFFKQWGEWAPDSDLAGIRIDPEDSGRVRWVDMNGNTHDGVATAERCADWAQMYRVGKKTAGRLLDGQIWGQYPRDVTTLVA